MCNLILKFNVDQHEQNLFEYELEGGILLRLWNDSMNRPTETHRVYWILIGWFLIGRSETAFLLDVGVYINIPTHCAVTVRFGAQSTSHERLRRSIFNVAMIANCRETSYAQFTVNDWTLGMVILLKRGAIAGSRTRGRRLGRPPW